MLNAGYTEGAHWLRLRIQAPVQGQNIELRIRPTYLDEVLLYEPDPVRLGQWLHRATGDKLGYAAQDRPSTSLGFSLALHAPLTTVYLRLQTTSNSLLTVEALTPHEARAKEVQADIALVIYLGFMLALLFWAVNEFLLSRERVLGMFLIYQFCYSLYSLAVMGFLPMLLPWAKPGALDLFTSVMVCLAPLLSLIFHRMLLGLFAPPRPILRVLEGLILLDLGAVAMLLGDPRQGLQFNALVILLAAPTFIALAFLARNNAAPGLRVIRTIYSLQGISMALSMLPFLGWISATEWSLHATLLHGFISAFLMFLLLHLRSRKLSRESSQAAVDLQIAHEQLALRNLQKQQQERFMAMLTHELKTPMAVIHMALGKLQLSDPVQRRVRLALTDMTAIVEDCQQVDQLEQQQLIAKSEPCNLAQILDEIKDRNDDAPQRLQIDAQGLPTITTDPQLLRIVLGNLIDNAFKYADSDSPIAIHAQASTQGDVPGVRVSVHNQVGLAGLPDADKVFEKYYRSPGAHRKTGSGLGLYLVKSYMQLLGGQVTYSVAETQVEFTLWIPC